MNTIVRLLSVDEQEHQIQVRDKKKKKKKKSAIIKLIEKEKKKPERKKRLSLNLGMYTIKDITFLLVNNSINNSYYWNAYLLHFSF